jgi:hypothetical protein
MNTLIELIHIYRFKEIESKIDEFIEDSYYMRKVIELHTVKIGRLEVRYKNNDR